MRVLGFILAAIGGAVGVYYLRVVILNPNPLDRPMVFHHLGCLAHAIAIGLVALGIWGVTLAF